MEDLISQHHEPVDAANQPWDYQNVHFLYGAHQFELAWDINQRLLTAYPGLTHDNKPHGAFSDALLRVLKGLSNADHNSGHRGNFYQ